MKKEEKEPKFRVGTTALNIITLLDLYQRTSNPKYLKGAQLGGDWLITMQKSNGLMMAKVEKEKGKWVYSLRESLLYNGQVLSALSRLYKVTLEKKYYQSAQRIAQAFEKKVIQESCYLGDDYRPKNSISSAWVIMSLLDFYKINQKDEYKNIIFKCSKELLDKQLNDENNLLFYGSWSDTETSSGTAFLAEVMVEIYKFCQEQRLQGCERYKQAVIKAIRYLIQNTYSEKNTSFLKNPEKARGGIFWNYQNEWIRTDSVCHALNAYVGIINSLREGTLLSIPK